MKVRIRNQEGHYLSGGGTEFGFCADAAKALVFDYVAHQVADQLAIIRETQGVALEIEEVDPKEILETCDRCARLVSPFNIEFDGRQFLCSECGPQPL